MLLDCDVSDVRFFISQHVPFELLSLAPHLMWIGSLSHSHANTCHIKLTAPLQAGAGLCLQELAVLELQVSGLCDRLDTSTNTRQCARGEFRVDLEFFTLHDFQLQLCGAEACACKVMHLSF